MTLSPLSGGHHHTQTSAATTWTITHNLNTSAPIVDCWVDNGGNKTKVMPLNVEATSALVCTVTFTDSQSGEAFLT